MDIRYSFEGLLFEWDQNKATQNLEKHGVSFESACEVFLDPLMRYTDTNDEDEATEAVIGEVRNGHLLFVVHIVKEEEEVIRLISARPATAREKHEYEE
jgi:uncharacterized DUF497 family protein